MLMFQNIVSDDPCPGNLETTKVPEPPIETTKENSDESIDESLGFVLSKFDQNE